MKIKYLFLFILTCLLFSNVSLATEGGGSMYPNGNENYTVGAAPPPGFYTMLYGTYQYLNVLRDNDGNSVRPGGSDFKVLTHVVAPRIVYVPKDLTVFGGQTVFHTILPIVNADVQIAGQRKTVTGLGDIVLGMALGYHVTNKFHYVLGLDINTPTGDYDKNSIVNLGRNYWNLEPLVAFSYVQPEGVNADLKIMYDFNFKNDATKYTSGQEFHTDYSIGWGLGSGWVVGLGGYVYQQTTDDTQDSKAIPNYKGQSCGIGPSIKYENGKGWLITAKWENDFAVKNRGEGHDIRVKMTVPF